MHRRRIRSRIATSGAALIATLVVSSAAFAVAPPSFDYATPLFGLTAGHGNRLLVADAGAGIVELHRGSATMIAELPGVTDVAPTRRGLWALTTLPDGHLYRMGGDGIMRAVADIGGFEARVNPDEGEIDSNPFDLAKHGKRRVLVADAAANALLIASRHGRVDWVATLPNELVPTDNAKLIAGCPDPAPDLAFVCDLPDQIPAQPVTTSVAVGPDGAYYLSELKGFPAPLGESQIWRIERGTRHARCGSSPACTVVADGFTSIVDITFGRDGSLHVVELDEASWLAVEFGGSVGGTVNTCAWGTWACTETATELPMPIAADEGRHGRLFVAIWALVPGQAQVIEV